MNARGFTLIEVLVTIIVLAIGLLGIASLTSKVQVAQVESYQRAQAVLMLEDMVARINANRGQAAAYATGADAPVGYDPDDPDPEACGALTAAARDLCEWSNALKGAAETVGGSAVGAMAGARGCVEEIQARNPAPGVCQPGIYRVSVAWQGLNPSAAPQDDLACGEGLYGEDERYRRLIAVRTVIATNSCEPS